MNIWQFAHEHWFVTIVMALIAGSVTHALILAPVRIMKIRARARNIEKHGWPKNPLMDADGDIVHPPAPEQE